MTLAAVVSCLPVACSSADGSDRAAPAGSGETIEHKFGTTEVPEDPERVATVGWNDQDVVLALGVVPVMTRAWFDSYDQLPWVVEATGGEPLPVAGGDGINFEEIAASDPDVIFAMYEAIDEPTYEKLSEIAPTVIQSDDYPDEETPWDVQLRTTGRALGKEDEADALLAEVDDRISTAVEQHPEFAGKVLAVDFGPESGGHYLIGSGDPRRALFDALGFEAPSHEGDLSEERLDELDADVLFVNGATREQMLASPTFAAVPVVAEDRALYTSFDSSLGGAQAYSGPTALIHALDVLVPQLANAVNGQPVTDLSDA